MNYISQLDWRASSTGRAIVPVLIDHHFPDGHKRAARQHVSWKGKPVGSLQRAAISALA